jgi:[protein-PII] uridylyltransferase
MSDEVKRALERARVRVEQLQRSGADPLEIMELHAQDVDLIVINLFEGALAHSRHDPAGVALVALGGYGRKELAPNSDLDLMLLYRGWSIPDVRELNVALTYPLYDSGRELGDRVREPRDVLRNLERVDEACAALDARLLTGDRGLFADMQGNVWRRFERNNVSVVTDLIKATAERHKRFGHAGHLLEPNIRDSAGGLRDIHTLGWASKLFPGGEGLEGLVASGRLSRIDADLVEEARTFLQRLRIELHLHTDRHQDQLYIGDQDAIANHFGYEATEVRPAADRLMQELAGRARQVDAVVESFWDRASHQMRRKRRWRSSSSENIGDGCVLVDGRVEVVAVTNVASDPGGWLRVFRRALLRDRSIGRTTLNRLLEEVAGAGEVSWSDDAREVFLDILQSGAGAVRALEAMDLSGLLVALIGDWEPVRAYPQRDLYHRYTVDRHLFQAVVELAVSRSSDDLDLRDAWSHVGDPDALFFAAFLHDVGKGRGGDHSALGAQIAVDTAKRAGLSPDQIADVEFLVSDHLALAETAMRRDLNESRTITETAARVGDLRRLAMLYLLTRADSLATGPEAWSAFRSALVRELYVRTRESLSGQSLPIGAVSEERSAVLDLLGESLEGNEVRTAVHHGQEADEFVVVAPDRPGLFSIVAGVLALRGFDVHDAEAYTRPDAVAVEIFRIVSAHGPVPEERWIRLADDIRAALRGELDLDAALVKKAAETRRRRGTRRPGAHSRVVVDNAASEMHTVVEVHTEDRIGLLRLITRTLAAHGCDLSLARVATYGLEVVDVFYVRDLDGHKIDSPERVKAIEDALLTALASDPARPRG